MSAIAQKKILLGVTGGIAAYKAVDLASKLTGCGAVVRTVMTESAGRFVGAKSFEAVTKQGVCTSLWEGPGGFEIEHVSLVEWADVVVIAPATANIIGKIAGGICDDLLSTVVCVCWGKRVLVAPAMNDNMWSNPIVQGNVEKLKQLGFAMVGPGKGRLACGTEGLGRMSEPTDIIRAIEEMLSK